MRQYDYEPDDMQDYLSDVCLASPVGAEFVPLDIAMHIGMWEPFECVDGAAILSRYNEDLEDVEFNY